MYAWILIAFTCGFVCSDWEKWWSYEGINGPTYWGQANPDWKLCKRGRQQSPINIEPSRLLFDPNLKHLKVDSSTVKGTLINSEHGISLEITNEGSTAVNVSLGPLSYTYRLAEIKFHLGNSDKIGSEHKVSGRSFPVEMQIIAYNSDLYKNVSDASKSVKGLAIISVFMEVGTVHDKFIFDVVRTLRNIRQKNERAPIKDIPVSHIIPNTTEYVTYEGSLTYPGCFETVTWILLNKPMWIAKDQLSGLRIIYNSRENEPNLKLEGNIRPVMQLNHRVVRTNINSHRRSRLCTFEKEMFYQVNTRFDKA